MLVPESTPDSLLYTTNGTLISYTPEPRDLGAMGCFRIKFLLLSNSFCFCFRFLRMNSRDNWRSSVLPYDRLAPYGTLSQSILLAIQKVWRDEDVQRSDFVNRTSYCPDSWGCSSMWGKVPLYSPITLY
jgi:hypothetical protein